MFFNHRTTWTNEGFFKLKRLEKAFVKVLAQLQNLGPNQRPLDIAATGCANYIRIRDNLNETV